jgi:hypothetical protein
MKKILTTMVVLVAGVTLVQAQGLLSWLGPTAHVSTNSTLFATGYPSTNGAAISGQTTGVSFSVAVQYYYVLLAATSTTANDAGNPLGSDWSVVDYSGGGIAYGTNFTAAGSVDGAGGTAGFASSLTAGTTYYMMVVGWSANLGNSWATVEGLLAGNWAGVSGLGITGLPGSNPAFFGYSNVGTITPTSAPANGAAIFGSTGSQPGQLVLYNVPVPEPTTLALAGLGGLSLLFLRRRKS